MTLFGKIIKKEKGRISSSDEQAPRKDEEIVE